MQCMYQCALNNFALIYDPAHYSQECHVWELVQTNEKCVQRKNVFAKAWKLKKCERSTDFRSLTFIHARFCESLLMHSVHFYHITMSKSGQKVVEIALALTTLWKCQCFTKVLFNRKNVSMLLNLQKARR